MIECNSAENYQMNNIISKFLHTGDRFMPELHLRQPAALGKPGFTYSACGLFTKNKERIKTFKETGDARLNKTS